MSGATLTRARPRGFLVLLALVVAALPALAAVHTALRRSQPAEGAHLSAVPDSVVLEYTERIDLATARVVLRDAANTPVALSSLRHGDSTRRVVVASVIGPVRPGAHALEWTVVGTDGHPVRGTVRFTIDSGATGLASAIDSVGAARDTIQQTPAGDDEAFFRGSTLAAGVVRFFTFATMLGLIGIAVVASVVLPRAAGLDATARERIMARARRYGAACAVGLLLLAGARLLLQAAMLGGGSVQGDVVASLLSGTTWGRAWILQVVAAVVAWALVRRRRASLALVVVCLAIALAASLSGHPVATPARAGLAVGLDTMHVLGAGAWLGSLAFLVIGGIPAMMTLPTGSRGVAVREVFEAFSPVALASAAVLVAAGVLAALIQLGGVSALLVSDYGRVLLVKLGIFAALLVVAAYHWRRVLPRLGSEMAAGRLRGTAALEVGLAMAVLVVTAVLTVTSPPVTAGP